MIPIDEVRSRYREEAIQHGISPRDVDLLLADLLSRSVGWLFAHGEEHVDPHPLEVLLERRFAGEPLQYIRGKCDFYGRELYVDNRVLIPRPETEILVETALARAPRGGSVVDVGTGSGCIAISIERERPDLQVTGTDLSLGALAVAKRNRALHGSRARLTASDLLLSLRARFDVIASNPPYVPLGEYEDLAVEVRIHEPKSAVTPGPSGFEIIERLLEESRTRLASGGCVILEVGYGQEAAMRALAATGGWTIDDFLPDLAGIPRLVVLSRDGDER